MKRALCIALLLAAGVTAGCSSPCDVLADLCSKCKDQPTKDACNQTVASYRAVPITGSTGCQAVLDAKTYDSCK